MKERRAKLENSIAIANINIINELDPNKKLIGIFLWFFPCFIEYWFWKYWIWTKLYLILVREEKPLVLLVWKKTSISKNWVLIFCRHYSTWVSWLFNCMLEVLQYCYLVCYSLELGWNQAYRYSEKLRLSYRDVSLV